MKKYRQITISRRRQACGYCNQPSFGLVQKNEVREKTKKTADRRDGQSFCVTQQIEISSESPCANQAAYAAENQVACNAPLSLKAEISYVDPVPYVKTGG
jgi:hypothetical protein